jgi:hypothetical protein
VALCSAPRAPPANKLGYSGRKFAGIAEHHEISCLIRLLPTLWKGSELPALWKGSELPGARAEHADRVGSVRAAQ